MASSSARKRKECSPTPSEGEGSSADSGPEEILDRPAFPHWDPWYTSSLLFPQVAHGADLPSLHTWVFFGKLGFTSSA